MIPPLRSSFLILIVAHAPPECKQNAAPEHTGAAMDYTSLTDCTATQPGPPCVMNAGVSG